MKQLIDVTYLRGTYIFSFFVAVVVDALKTFLFQSNKQITEVFWKGSLAMEKTKNVGMVRLIKFI